MKTSKPLWFLINNEDGGIMAKNGRFYKKLSHVGDMKMWTSQGWAARAADKMNLDSYTCKAVYDCETVDVCGRIYNTKTGSIR